MTDIGAIASTATQMSQLQAREQAQISVLKKAIDMSASGAMQLLEALPQLPATAADPAHRVGTQLDVRA